MKAEYLSLIDFILSHDRHYVDVWTGGDEPDVHLSRDKATIIDAIESVDMAEINVYHQWHDGADMYFSAVFWAQIIPFGVAPDETVADYSDNGYYTPVITDGGE